MVGREGGTAQDGGSRGAREATTRWVSLGRACEILGVNESTVRRWADSEQIRCFRTPGGHRRFAEADLHALTEGRRDAEHELETAAVSRIRRQLSGRRGGADWLVAMEDEERGELRVLGRELVELVGDYLSRRRARAEIEQQVDAIGRRYGLLLRQRATPLRQAIEAFTFFRRSLDETAKQLSERNHLPPDEAARAREQIAGLADRVLLELTASYDDGPPRGR